MNLSLHGSLSEATRVFPPTGASVFALASILHSWQQCAVAQLNVRSKAIVAVRWSERQRQFALLRECLVVWCTSTAESHSLELLLAQERFERANAECRRLRVHDEQLSAEVDRLRAVTEESQAKAKLAELELKRRSQCEFADLRELQQELVHLRAEVAAAAIPGVHPCNVSPRVSQVGTRSQKAMMSQALRGAAQCMLSTFWEKMPRAWLRLYLLVWRSQVGAHDLELTVVDHCSMADSQLLCGRVVAAWHALIEYGRCHRAIEHFASSVTARHWKFLVRVVLLGWRAQAIMLASRNNHCWPSTKATSISPFHKIKLQDSHGLEKNSAPALDSLQTC